MNRVASDGLIIKIALGLAIAGFFVGFFQLRLVEVPSRSEIEWRQAAEQHLETLLERPAEFMPWRRLGQSLGRRYDLERAIGWWRERVPKDFRQRWGDGILWYWIGRSVEPADATDFHREAWRRSADSLTAFVEERPAEATWLHWHYLIWAHVRLDRRERAIDAAERLSRVVERTPLSTLGVGQRLSLWENVAAAMRGLDAPATERAAIDRMKRLLDEHGPQGDLQRGFNWFDLAALYESRGDLHAAVEALRGAESHIEAVASPDVAYRYAFNVARAYESRDRPREAQRVYETIIRIIRSMPAPDEPLAEDDPRMRRGEVDTYNLACALALAGRTDAALDALAQAVEQGYLNDRHATSDPDLESLRGLDRFEALLLEMRARREAERAERPEASPGLRSPRFDRP